MTGGGITWNRGEIGPCRFGYFTLAVNLVAGVRGFKSSSETFMRLALLNSCPGADSNSATITSRSRCALLESGFPLLWSTKSSTELGGNYVGRSAYRGVCHLAISFSRHHSVVHLGPCL